MRESKAKTDRKTHINELHGICTTHEAGVLRRYIEHRLDELAREALVCRSEDLHHIQGRAKELRDMESNLMNGPKTPPGQTKSE